MEVDEYSPSGVDVIFFTSHRVEECERENCQLEFEIDFCVTS